MLLQQIMAFAMAQGRPEWDVVTSAAHQCFANQPHGDHDAVTPTMRYHTVCQALTRIQQIQAGDLLNDPSQAIACLAEVHHGGAGGGGSGGGRGGGGSGPGNQFSKERIEALRKLRRRILALCKRL
jgi:hypothetical protein